jgi:hypothetical protein
MKIRRCFALLLVLSIISCFAATSASAAVQYEQISSVSNELTVSGTTLTVTASTVGYSDATKCGVTATLQKLSGSNWSNYKVWTATSPSSHPDYVLFGTSITVSAGQYRLVTSHSVTVGSTTEYEGITSPTRVVS